MYSVLVEKWNTSVHFYVQRNTDWKTLDIPMKYEVERLNMGNAINIETGIFTVPKAGIYHFTFSFVKHAYASGTHVSLQPNREHVGNAHATF